MDSEKEFELRLKLPGVTRREFLSCCAGVAGAFGE